MFTHAVPRWGTPNAAPPCEAVAAAASPTRRTVGALRTPHLPARAGPIPRKPHQYFSGAGWDRSELWKRTPGLWREAPRLNLQSFPASAGPIPNKRYAGGAGWGRSELWKRTTELWARSAKAEPSELPCERRTHPAEPHPRLKTTISPNITPTPSGSGIGPERALEAITQPLAQQRESSSSPKPTCESRTDPAERRRGTDPQRQPRHSATAPQNR
jgi:hypothetical protein